MPSSVTRRVNGSRDKKPPIALADALAHQFTGHAGQVLETGASRYTHILSDAVIVIAAHGVFPWSRTQAIHGDGSRA